MRNINTTAKPEVEDLVSISYAEKQIKRNAIDTPEENPSYVSR